MAHALRAHLMRAAAIAGRPMGMSMSLRIMDLARRGPLMRAATIAARPVRVAMSLRIMGPALRGRLMRGPAIAGSNLLGRCLFCDRGPA